MLTEAVKRLLTVHVDFFNPLLSFAFFTKQNPLQSLLPSVVVVYYSDTIFACVANLNPLTCSVMGEAVENTVGVVSVLALIFS